MQLVQSLYSRQERVAGKTPGEANGNPEKAGTARRNPFPDTRGKLPETKTGPRNTGLIRYRGGRPWRGGKAGGLYPSGPPSPPCCCSGSLSSAGWSTNPSGFS